MVNVAEHMVNGSEDVVIGIDGGGTHTRVMVADLTGRVLSYVENGSSSLHKDLQASKHVRQALADALALAGKSANQVAMLTAGIAGFDSEADYEWVRPLTELEGLDCPNMHVNDAVVAHSGALLTEPGIIAIAGTGSILFAVNEAGRRIRNYDFHHYAASAARFLAYDVTYELLAGNNGDSDRALVDGILGFWEQPNVQELSRLASYGFVEDRRERDKRFAELAPLITSQALTGSRLARTVCDRAIHQMTVGIEMLATQFAKPEVSVALIGSVVNSEYIRQEMAFRLAAGANRAYRFVQPAFSPVAGAVLLAMRQLNLPIDEPLLHRLGLHENARA